MQNKKKGQPVKHETSRVPTIGVFVLTIVIAELIIMNALNVSDMERTQKVSMMITNSYGMRRLLLR